MKVRISPKATGGRFTLIETTHAPGYGPPLHRHREAEYFYVLNGRYLYEVNHARFEVEAGDTVMVPGNVPHGFVNIDTQPSKQLVLLEPGLDAMAFFMELGGVMKDGELNVEARNVFSARWGVDFLGPPLKPARVSVCEGLQG
ncbi:cupin domain-containing protein [Paraburkholderia sp. LEh10]|uniref:cupin domain-containing protein n=1 Tax=Paraburkholderia sp. LEh10 TaxID=2821353 RepID=UPI001FD76233|nr:cupin domain-containing protein [Paraburkholderia sp. LEh10]